MRGDGAGSLRGESVGISVPDLAGIVPSVDPDGRLEAVLVFRRTGKVVAAWSRTPVSIEVATVMGATLLGSVDSLWDLLGDGNPREVSVLAGGLRLFALKPQDSFAILLVGREPDSEDDLRASAQRIAGTFSRIPSPGRPPLRSETAADAKP